MKRYTRILLGVMLWTVMILGCANTANAEIGTGTLYVGAQDIVNAADQTVRGGSGTAKLTYDKEGKPVLTLNNYSYTGEYQGILYMGREPLNIVLKDNNSIVSSFMIASVMSDYGSLIISGSGKLEVSNTDIHSTNVMLLSGGDLTIDSGTLILSSPETTEVAYNSTITIHGGLTVNNGTFAVTAIRNGKYYSEGIVVKGDVTINGGTVTTTGGNAPNESCGLDITGDGSDLTINGGTLTATAGTTSGEYGHSYGVVLDGGGIEVSAGKLTAACGATDSSRGDSNGIWAMNSVNIHGGTVTAAAGDGYSSRGLYIHDGDLNVDGGTLTGMSGSGGMDNYSCGVDTYSRNINLNGGKITAIAGKVSRYGESFGIKAENVTVKEGTLIAMGGETEKVDGQSEYLDPQSYAIGKFGTLDIQGGAVIASGNTSVHFRENTVKNAFSGTGWDNAEGTGTGTEIPESASARSIKEYKKVFFHSHPIVYTADSAGKITRKCQKDGCDVAAASTLTIKSPLHKVEGDGKDPAARITDKDHIRGNAKIKYYKAKANGNREGGKLSTAPGSAGRYRAEITVEGATAYVVYKISPAPVGSTFTVSGSKYVVTSENTVSLSKAGSSKTITVPAAVKIGSRTVKVTGIKAKAFKGNKTETLIIKSGNLTKKSVTNSLKGSKVKVIKVKVGSKKENNTYIEKYKKIFTGKNAGKTVKVQ